MNIIKWYKMKKMKSSKESKIKERKFLVSKMTVEWFSEMKELNKIKKRRWAENEAILNKERKLSST